MIGSLITEFQNNPNFIQVVIIVAAAATIIMILQLILMLIGMGTDSTFDGADGDTDVDTVNDSGFFEIFGLRLLTLRNIIAFFAIGGWTIVAIYEATESFAWSIPFGILAGIVTMVLISFFTRQMEKMQSNGVVEVQNSVGKKGTVYLTIPGFKQGYGKVNVVVQERLVEFEAMTEDDAILTGSEVVITEACDGYVLVKKN